MTFSKIPEIAEEASSTKVAGGRAQMPECERFAALRRIAALESERDAVAERASAAEFESMEKNKCVTEETASKMVADAGARLGRPTRVRDGCCPCVAAQVPQTTSKTNARSAALRQSNKYCTDQRGARCTHGS